MTKKARLLVLGSVLCLIVSPAAFADLFGFSVSNPLTTFDGTQFQATDGVGTLLSVYRNLPPASTATVVPVAPPFLWNQGGTLEDFVLSMTISNVTATTAQGSGWFAITDIEGDIIGGNIAGVWTKDGGGGKFSGSLSNVTYGLVVDDAFDGYFGSSASMNFSSPQPWNGSVTEITMTGAWFQWTNTGALFPFEVQGGSVDARVVPAPAAFLLGLLGMGVAGVRLRRFA